MRSWMRNFDRSASLFMRKVHLFSISQHWRSSEGNFFVRLPWRKTCRSIPHKMNCALITSFIHVVIFNALLISQGVLGSSNLALWLLGTCRYACVKRCKFMRSFLFLELKFAVCWHVCASPQLVLTQYGPPEYRHLLWSSSIFSFIDLWKKTYKSMMKQPSTHTQ